MNILLFDDPGIKISLLPFTYTRPVAAIRTGILTIAEKWEKYVGQPCSFSTSETLTRKFPASFEEDNLWINGAVCPDPDFFEAIKNLKLGGGLRKGTQVLAYRTREHELPEIIHDIIEYTAPFTLIDQVWKIFQCNGAQLRSDFDLITKGRKSQPIEDAHTRTYHPERIFLEEGVQLFATILNATQGPIYLGNNSQVQDGSMVRGAFALGQNSILNVGSKIRGDVSIGPECKLGGEVSTSVVFGYSNKAHDGFLGCSVLGEWCNMGADSNTSNLKNNYDNVKLWNYANKGFIDTGLTFCGLMMGDHSKCGINTMFNTGTVVGVGANIFGDGFPRNFVPSFAWGGAAGFSTFQLNKFFETATKAMERRNVPLTTTDKLLLEEIYMATASERVWEKKSN
jgi:UDP-N-acetylglucosamine diphosphorylase/glucosamine-1-phosphate N-acetyltransferase